MLNESITIATETIVLDAPKPPMPTIEDLMLEVSQLKESNRRKNDLIHVHLVEIGKIKSDVQTFFSSLIDDQLDLQEYDNETKVSATIEQINELMDTLKVEKFEFFNEYTVSMNATWECMFTIRAKSAEHAEEIANELSICDDPSFYEEDGVTEVSITFDQISLNYVEAE